MFQSFIWKEKLLVGWLINEGKYESCYDSTVLSFTNDLCTFKE